MAQLKRVGVIFDMDGVIFDSERVYIEGYVKYAADYPDIRAVSLSCVGTTGKRTREIFLERYGEDFPFDAYYQKVREYVMQHQIPLKPCVREIFAYLKENRIPTALASSTRQERVNKLLTDEGLTDCFDAIICGDMVFNSKPHPEIFLTAAERIGIAPADCYVLEDSYNGIRAAHNAGMHPIMVPDILQPDDEIRALTEAVLPDLGAVIDYLKEVIA